MHITIIFAGFIFTQIPTILEPGFQPFNSAPYLTPTSSPATSININWNTETQESTIVVYGLTPTLKDTIKVSGVRNYHHIMLSNLLSSTGYYYKILPSGNINTFKTFPLSTDSFTFIAFGDTRSDSVAHQSVIDRMAMCDFDFIVHSGDFVKKGDNPIDWRTFFNIEDTLLQYKHILPAMGNHENPYWPYDTLFALPDAKYFYSVNYGNAHFIILDTQIDLYGPQRNWLINDLITANSDTSIAWIFVNLHRPPYSSGSHGSQIDVQNAWCPIFEEYGVELVFCGHDHSYERTKSINGVNYIITGGGGAPLYDVSKNDWTAYANKTYHFCLVEITDKKLVLKAIKPDGVIFDSLIINKKTP